MPLPVAEIEWSALAADVLVFVGLLVVTLGVIGLFRMPDVYTQLHAAGKAVFLGLIALLVASLATRDSAIASRALLIAAFLILTTPVGAHVIARAAYRRGESMKTPGAVDESGSGLNAPDRSTPAEEMTAAETARARED
jgi:multicomponent Na+:H+ antiporter subunit G